jgi:predicted RNA binding protein YcfA (HicA-like mRNA interferase family)
MKSADAIRQLKTIGWTIKRQGRGSHIILIKGEDMLVLSHPSELSEGMAGKVRSFLRAGRDKQ